MDSGRAFTCQVAAFHTRREFFMRGEHLDAERAHYMPDGRFYAGRALFTPRDHFTCRVSVLHARWVLQILGERFTFQAGNFSAGRVL